MNVEHPTSSLSTSPDLPRPQESNMNSLMNVQEMTISDVVDPIDLGKFDLDETIDEFHSILPGVS